MKQILGILIMIATVIFAGYLVFWWGIVEPIIEVYDHMQNDTLTGALLGWSIVKFFLKEVVAWVVGIAGFAISSALMSS